MSPQQRTFQDPSGPYQLPNDATEHDRLDAQSASLIALMNNKPIHAPLSSPQRILDIGCGTGAMTVYLAKLYPKAEVIGVDIAPVPEGSRHGAQPPNIKFIQGDVRKFIDSGHPLFQQGSFDFIFQRLLICGLTDWPGHISAVSTLLKPGGWLECHEVSWMLYTPSGKRVFDTVPFYEPVKADAEARGLNVEIGAELADTFRGVGNFGEVKETVYECAPWGRAERPELQGLESGILDLFVFLVDRMAAGRRSEAEIEEIKGQVEKQWKEGFDGSERMRVFVVSGQKKV